MDASVTFCSTEMIPDQAVTTPKIADGNVTLDKIATTNKAVSSAISSQSFTSPSFVDATNLSVSINSGGNELEILLVPDGTAALSQTKPCGVCLDGGTYGANPQLGFFRFYDSTAGSEIAGFELRTTPQDLSQSSGVWPPACFYAIYSPASGSRTIKVQMCRGGATTANVYLSHCKLYVRERK